MSHAERCPVCDGTGKLPVFPSYSGSVPGPLTECHGCRGKGWVTVPDDSGYDVEPPGGDDPVPAKARRA